MNFEHSLFRYYKSGMEPFNSVSTLSDAEIITFMQENFPKHRWFHSNPSKKVKRRREVEQWLYEGFVAIGGEPVTRYPCYFTLGQSTFLKAFESFEGSSAEIEVPLRLFSTKNISFTYPDSFFSYWLMQHKGHELYNEKLHGRVFSLDEIKNLLAQGEFKENISMTTATHDYPFYIEAQVWNYEILHSFHPVRTIK